MLNYLLRPRFENLCKLIFFKKYDAMGTLLRWGVNVTNEYSIYWFSHRQRTNYFGHIKTDDGLKPKLISVVYSGIGNMVLNGI